MFDDRLIGCEHDLVLFGIGIEAHGDHHVGREGGRHADHDGLAAIARIDDLLHLAGVQGEVLAHEHTEGKLVGDFARVAG